jgi:hypothetical protein
LLIPQRGGGRSAQGHEATLLQPGRTAAVVSASLPATVEVDSNYQGFGVRIAADVMERTLHMLTGVQRATPFGFLRERRLALAHARLATSSSATVAEVVSVICARATVAANGPPTKEVAPFVVRTHGIS